MRDPKTGFVVEQVLAPAHYIGGSHLGPEFDVRGFESAAIILNLGAGPFDPLTEVSSASIVFGVKLEREVYPGHFEKCADFVPSDFGPEFKFPHEGQWASLYEQDYDFYQGQAIWKMRLRISHHKRRLSVRVKPGSVYASAILLKGHPTQRPAT